MTQKLLAVLSGQKIDPPPIWMMRQAGRHLPEYRKIREKVQDFVELCFTPELAAKVTMQPVDRYDMDAAILFADILLIPLAMGRNLRFEKNVGPLLDPIKPQEISLLSDKTNMELLNPVYQTVSLVRSHLSADKSLIGFCGGPWTVATYMIEGRGSAAKEMAKRFAYEHSEKMDDLLRQLAVLSAEYLAGQAKAGADALMIFESWAEGLAPPLFERLVIRPANILIAELRARGVNLPIIGFPRGAGLSALTYAENLDISAIGAGTDVPLEKMRDLVGDMPIQGNLDPLALRIGGEALRSAVDEVLEAISGPHIFNLGHGIAPDVKIENVHAVIDHIRTGRGNYV